MRDSLTVKNWWKSPKFKNSNETFWVIFKQIEIVTIPFSFYFLHILPVRSRGSHMFLTVMSRMHIRRTAKKSFIKKLSWIHGKVFLASCESNSIRIRLSVTISHTSIEVICQSIRYIWHLWKKKLITFFATFSASGARKNFRDFLFSSDSCY